MNCQHTKRIGDNYGLACQECGIALEGYGYGGWFGSNLNGNEQCLHIWFPLNQEKEQQCKYGEIVRESKKKTN